MNQGLSFNQKTDVTLEHTIAPHQLQSLDILAANRMELETKIQTELAENPVLEIVEGPDPESDPEQEQEQNDNYGDLDFVPSSGIPGSESLPERTENLDENREDFSESLDRFMESGDDFFLNEGAEEQVSPFDTIASEISLQEQLLQQLHLSDAPEELIPAAEEVIGNIDNNGYFESAPAEIAQTLQCPLETAEKALALVQTFDPPGIGARDLQECLMLQLDRDPGKYDPRLRELVRKHLEDIGRNRLPQIAKSMDIPMEDLQMLLTELKQLAPHPAASAVPGGVIYIRPEVQVERDPAGNYRVVPNRESIPRLRLSDYYLKMLQDPNTPHDAKTYIREKIASAEQLMHNLAQRTSTIERVSELIVAAQHDFFEVGPEALKPMTMREIADRIGRDESTVSRAVAGKYMLTPRGLMAMRDFFSGGFRQEGGGEISSRGIKEIIRETVDAEDPTAPVSDSKIEAVLKEQGFTVARRTIAKYREELGIPSSQLRKVYR